MTSKNSEFIKIILLITSLSVVTVILAVYLSRGGSDGLPFPKALVVSDDVGLWALDLRNGSTKILHSTKNVIHSFDIYKNKTIYWKEAGRSSIESLSKSEKYPIFESSRNWEPKSLKIDYLTKKVYVLDKDTNSLQVFDMNIKQHGIVMTGLDRPRDFAIDTRKRLLFVVQKDSIFRADLDGYKPEIITCNQEFKTITLDEMSFSIYVTDHSNIWSLNYQGENLQRIISIPQGINAISVLENQLFWTSAPGIAITGELWSCTLPSIDCNRTTHVINSDLKNPRLVKAYNEGFHRKFPNFCEHDNGNCQQLCYSNERGKSCGCRIGFTLGMDSEKCDQTSDLFLFIEDFVVRGASLNHVTDELVDSIQPFKLANLTLKSKKNIHFDYDVKRKLFVYTDDHGLYVRSLENDAYAVELERNHNFQYGDVAVDWITGNVYFIKGVGWNSSDENNSWVFVKNLHSKKKHIVREIYKFMRQYWWPTSLLLDPNNGYIYFTIKQNIDNRYHLYRLEVNGLHLTPISNKSIVKEDSLAIDYKNSRIIWIGENSVVYHTNLNGTDIKNVTNSGWIDNPKSIAFDGDWMYVGNSTAIWRVSKSKDTSIRLIHPVAAKNRVISKFKRYDVPYPKYLENLEKRNPCAANDNGCGHFCFAIPQMIHGGLVNTGNIQKFCACDVRKEIQEDGKSCK